MKKVAVLIISLFLIASVSKNSCYNVHKMNNDSMELLLDKLKHIEEKKNDVGMSSDMICKKIAPQWIALGCGLGGSLCALLSKVGTQENKSTDSIIGNFFACGISAYIVTKLIGYFGADRIKKTVEKEILHEHYPELEALKKKNNVDDVHFLEQAYNLSEI